MKNGNGFKAYELGAVKNILGILSTDHKSLSPEAFFSATGLKRTHIAKILGVQRPMLYRNELPLKPVSKIYKTVISLVIATDLAYDLLNKNKNETKQWLMAPNTLFFGSSPFEVVMRGEGEEIISYLKERSGQKSGLRFKCPRKNSNES